MLHLLSGDRSRILRSLLKSFLFYIFVFLVHPMNIFENVCENLMCLLTSHNTIYTD